MGVTRCDNFISILTRYNYKSLFMKTTTTLTLKKSRKLKLEKVTISKLNAQHLFPILVDGPGQSTHPVCDFTQVTTVMDVAVF